MRTGHAHVPLSAIAMVVGAVSLFAITDSMMKWLASRHPVPLVVWTRWGSQVLLMSLWLVPRMGTRLVRTRRLRLHLVRGALLITSSVCIILALKHLPLADATALSYLTPTLVTLLAAALLHERLTAPRVAFVAAGLVGMLLIVRPGGEIFRGASLFALGSALCYSFYQIATRMVPGDEDVRVSLFYPALVGASFMTIVWPWFGAHAEVGALDVALMLGTGVSGTFGHLLFISALQRAPVSAVTPFTYMHLVFATTLGWLVFSQFPDALTIFGMALIAGSGLFLSWHERRRALLAAPPAVD